MVEVGHTDDCVDNREDDQYDGNHGKGGQTPPNGKVGFCFGGLVDADKLEEEVG